MRVMEKKFINPLLPLDPHTENTRDKKPLKKGSCDSQFASSSVNGRIHALTLCGFKP